MKLDTKNIPREYIVNNEHSRSVIALPQYMECLAAADISSLPEVSGGRGTVRRLCAQPRNLLLRTYHRGGILRKLNTSSFLTPSRPLEELKVCCEAAARGLSVPVVAGAIINATTFAYECILATEEIEGAVDLEGYLEQLSDDEKTGRREIMEAVAQAVRKMHDAGLYHADLQLKNILVKDSADGPEIFFIDLDKSVIRNEMPDRLKAANLRRLNRSAVKKHTARPEVSGFQINDDERRMFLREYAAGETLFAGSIEQFVKSCRRHTSLHALGWRLFGNNKAGTAQ